MNADSGELERQEIDRQFGATAVDEKYLTFNVQLAEVFKESDWEALTKAEEQEA